MDAATGVVEEVVEVSQNRSFTDTRQVGVA
jgi:hypothetical protein